MDAKKIDVAIENLADRITSVVQYEQALKFTQSILNLAHAKEILQLCEKDAAKEKASALAAKELLVALAKDTAKRGANEDAEKKKKASAS